MSIQGGAPGMHRIYSRTGFADVSELDAVSTCNNHPREWSLTPWPLSEMRETVSPDWRSLPASERIALAEQLIGSELSSASEADAEITAYLATQGH